MDRIKEPAVGPSGHSYTFLGFHRQTGDPIKVVAIKPPPKLGEIDRIVFEVPPSDAPYEAHPRDVVATVDGKLWRDFVPPEPEKPPVVDAAKAAEFLDEQIGTQTSRASSAEPNESNIGKPATEEPSKEVWLPEGGVPTYYIDTENGNDGTGDGTSEKPWRSLAFAKAAIRCEHGGHHKCIIREGCALIAQMPDNPSYLKTDATG